MRNHYSSILLCILFFEIFISCNNRFYIQTYSYVPYFENIDSLYSPSFLKVDLTRKSITIINDTTLNYNILLGGIGISSTIRFRKLDNVLFIDSVDVYNNDTFQQYTNEIFGHKLSFSKGSLIDLNNNQEYLSQRYFDKNFNKPHFESFYIIINDKREKITSRNAKRVIKSLYLNNQTLIELDKEEAKEKYGINHNFKTYRVIKK